MSKKYIREGGMCQFFDEHYHYQGGIDWDRIHEDPLHGTKCKPNEETYSSKMAQIIGERAEQVAKEKEQKKEEIHYNYNYKTF